MLLQILEEGKLTDNVGRVVDFRNTIIIMTSNVGADLIKRRPPWASAANSDENSYEQMKEKILDEAKRVFKPEFLNRLDDIIVFRSLTKPDLIKILTSKSPRSSCASRPSNCTRRWTTRPGIFWSRRATTRPTARARCAGPSSAFWKTRWPRKSSKAA